MKNKIIIIIILILLKSSEVFSVISSGGNFSTMLKSIMTISGKSISSDGSITVIHYGGSINLGGGQLSGGDYQMIGIVGGSGLFGTSGPALNLTNVKVYPNPYKPGTSSEYDNSLLGEGVVFTNLTAKAKVKIYNISGEFITEFEETNADGLYLWDTKNSYGKKVASGVYIYFVINPDNQEQTTKGKFVIIR